MVPSRSGLNETVLNKLAPLPPPSDSICSSVSPYENLKDFDTSGTSCSPPLPHQFYFTHIFYKLDLYFNRKSTYEDFALSREYALT